MSRISGGSYQAIQQTKEPVEEETPGHPIGGEPTVFGIPTPTAIIPSGQHVSDLPPHQEREPPPILTIGNPTIGPTPATTTTTTTTSQHWLHGRLARSDQKAPKPQRERTPSPMGGSTQLTAEPEEVELVRPKPIQPNAEKGENEKREKVARALSVHRLARPLARTEETPVRREHTPPPMENSAPAEPANRRNSDPPEEWRKTWHHEVKNIKGSDWCGKVLAIIDRRADRVPDLDELKTLPRMRAAYRYGLSAAEAASIFLYTSAAFKEINEPLREGNLDKLRPNRRNALKTIIANIDSGLMKLPEVKEPLVRVVRLKTNLGQNLQVGTEWREPAFGSCFRADKRNMKWDGNHELLIAVTSGARDVSALSDAPNEGEVLVERGRTYRIGKRTLEGGRVKLELSEVAPKRKST
jgi:ADP-ribosyltransferase exoenzyme